MIVSFTAHNRVDYMTRVLDSWRNVRDVDQATLLFRCEPGTPAMPAVCDTAEQFAGAVAVTVNPAVYGALTNPWHALEDGFAEDDFVILAEDDSAVSDDILDYFAHCRIRYRDNPGVLAVCSFCGSGSWCQPDPAVITEQDWFSPTIWGTWADRWPELRDTWDHDYTSGDTHQAGWDWNIRLRVLQGRTCVFPARSRSQHIGEHGGTHMLPKDFEAQQSRCFQLSYGPVRYRTI